MSNINKTIARQKILAAQNAYKFWQEVCKEIPLNGEPIHSRAEDLAARAGITRTMGTRYMRAFRLLDMVDYYSLFSGNGGGQRVMFTRKMSLEDGSAILQGFIDRVESLPDSVAGKPRSIRVQLADGRIEERAGAAVRQQFRGRKNKEETPVVTQDQTDNPFLEVTKPNETVAIVGEDAPTPLADLISKKRTLAEPNALMEAARQYLTRSSALDAKVAELEALGITVDREKFYASVTVERDEVLEAVAGMLPEWDRLNRRVDGLVEDNAKLREEVAQRRRSETEARAELQRQTDANKRLSERNAELAGKVTSRDQALNAAGLSLPQ